MEVENGNEKDTGNKKRKISAGFSSVCYKKDDVEVKT